MAETWGIKVAKWFKITNAEENKTVDILTDSQGDDRLQTESEHRDLEGATNQYNGSVGASPVSIPAFAGNVISEVIIQNTSVGVLQILQVSLDGGANYFSLRRNSHLGWSVKGYQTQIRIRSANAFSVNYEAIINFEAF